MKTRVIHKIHNSGINIFGDISLCQLYLKYIFSYSPFLKEPWQVTHVFRETPNSGFLFGS